MKSYQLLAPEPQQATVEQGRPLTITVKLTAATRLLKSVYTGQGFLGGGQLYMSYAAVVGGAKIVWHKPMRTPTANNH